MRCIFSLALKFTYFLSGVLFVPRGSGPFPGILEISSGGGGVEENRAALLAHHGFLTLALAYFAYEDLPKTIIDFKDIRLFDAAIDWLLRNELVQPGGIGMIGPSFAASSIMTAIMRNDKVVSTICINCGFLWLTDGSVTSIYNEQRKAEGMAMIPEIGI